MPGAATPPRAFFGVQMGGGDSGGVGSGSGGFTMEARSVPEEGLAGTATNLTSSAQKERQPASPMERRQPLQGLPVGLPASAVTSV